MPVGLNKHPAQGLEKFLPKGLTVRQWFAGMALQGILSNETIIKSIASLKMKPKESQKFYAELSYTFADEMLKVRKNKND